MHTNIQTYLKRRKKSSAFVKLYNLIESPVGTVYLVYSM